MSFSRLSCESDGLVGDSANPHDALEFLTAPGGSNIYPASMAMLQGADVGGMALVVLRHC